MSKSEAGNGIPVTVDAVVERKRGLFSWLSNKGIVKLNAILLLSQISSYATGYDGSMMNGLQSLDTWKASFNNPGAQELALLNCIQSVGQLAAIPLCAVVCDHFGRKPSLIASAFILLIGTVLQVAAQNVAMFIVARATLGFGLAINITAAPLLIMELSYPAQRAPMVSIYNSLWGLGALAAAWITFGTFRVGTSWAWRIPSVLQGLSSIIQIGLCFLIEESPRWLVSKDRIEEAEQLIVKYHANGDASDPIVPLEMEEIRTALRLEMEASKTGSYMAFFQTRGNRRRFWIILAVSFFSQWSGNGLISYYLTLILDSIGYTSESTQTLINALVTLWGLIWGIFFACIVNRFGRRTLFMLSTAGCLICYVLWTIFEALYEKSTDLSGSGNSGMAKAVLAMIFLYNFTFCIGWTPLQVAYVVEILPYKLRARGLVLYNLFVSLALIFNQYANPVGVTKSGWKFYITYDVWLLFELIVIYFLFVETGKLSLEETAAILDGEEMEHKLQDEVARNTEKRVIVGQTEEVPAEPEGTAPEK